MATGIWVVRLLAFLSTMYQQGASGQQLRMAPENIAGVVGSSVVLQCQGSVDDTKPGIIWNEYISTTATTSIAFNGIVYPNAPNSQLYNITGDSSVAKYHLNIELAFLSGGRYECNQPDKSLFGRSHVTVLQSDPVCSDTIQADDIVEEDEMITYTCEVAYNSTSIDWPPVMNWTSSNGANTDMNKLSTSGKTITGSLNVTGTHGLNGAVYSVRTHFEPYGGSLPPYHATNVPTYSHLHRFNALQVYYSPRDIAIQPDGSTFNPGERLTCRSVGNPAVFYKWYNSTNNSTLADGAELTIREEMDGLTCGCEAYNTIRGTKRSMSKEITLTVTKAPTTTTRSTTETDPTQPTGCPSTKPITTETLTPCICSNPSPGVVAGIAIAVILLLCLLVVSGLLLWRMRNSPCEKCKQMSNQHHPANSNSSYGVYETPNSAGMTGQSSEYTELAFT